MGITILFTVFAVLLLLGVPVAFALAAAALATLWYLDLPTLVLVQQISAGTGSASLIAIPLFIFAGEIMMRGGISERLISLASSLVGRMRGGLGQVSILSSLFFGGVSGSAIADVSAVGGTMIPQMVKRGYDRDFAVNVSITAALVALLVPPSHNLILFSAAAGGGLSIADLFAAGIVPALLMTVALMVTGYVVARRRGYGVEIFPGWRAVLLRLVSALPGLGLVALIFIGIRAGIFTAVESAAIAVVYALLVTTVLYRQLDWREFLGGHPCRAQHRRDPVRDRDRGGVRLAAGVSGSALGGGQLPAVVRAQPVHGAVDDRGHAVAAGHLHGPGADDPDLHADLPAGGQGLRHRSDPLRPGAGADRWPGPGDAAGGLGAVHRYRDRQDQRR